jgi:23S rRNA (uracil-5-)-methyltransferase RumA
MRPGDESLAGERLSCPVARSCGGCALIDEPYEAQLRFKTELVRTALRQWPDLPVDRVESCLPAPVRRDYRNRAKLAVAAHGGGVRVGLFHRGTNQIVDLAPCRVQRPVLQDALERLRRWLARHRLARPAGPVFYLDLREAAGGHCHVTLVVDGTEVDAEELPLDALAEGWPGLIGVAVNFGDASSSFPLGPVTRIVLGESTFDVAVPVAGKFAVPPGGFFQAAPPALAAVHDLMASHLAGAGTIFDLYCGVGVHGLSVAGRPGGSPRVVGIEESASLVEAARSNASRLELNAAYETGRVEERLASWSVACPSDGIILNPGRSGCRPPVLEALTATHPACIAYLSCNPTTLARDLAALRIPPTRIIPLDLLPHTNQIETLTLL